MSLVLHRPIPEGFEIKSLRVVCKHSGWYEIASGAEVSGALETLSRQLAMKLENLQSDLEKPVLYS
jgi:hypothetical protein